MAENPTIAEVLHNIQQRLKAPKNQVNKFGGFNYRSCEDIVEAVKKLLPSPYSLILSDTLEHIGERYYIKAIATLSGSTHSSGDHISSVAYARETESKKGMDSAQITGATSSYARKYALNGLFGIDDTKDADHDSHTDTPMKQNKGGTAAKEPKPTPTPTSKPKPATKPPGSRETSGTVDRKCPECGATAPVIDNKFKKGHLTCWKGHEAKGCGHVWKPETDVPDQPVPRSKKAEEMTSDPKGKMYYAIGNMVKEFKISNADFKAMKTMVNKKTYPVGWSVEDMKKLGDFIMAEYGEEEEI